MQLESLDLVDLRFHKLCYREEEQREVIEEISREFQRRFDQTTNRERILENYTRFIYKYKKWISSYTWYDPESRLHKCNYATWRHEFKPYISKEFREELNDVYKFLFQKYREFRVEEIPMYYRKSILYMEIKKKYYQVVKIETPDDETILYRHNSKICVETYLDPVKKIWRLREPGVTFWV